MLRLFGFRLVLFPATDILELKKSFAGFEASEIGEKVPTEVALKLTASATTDRSPSSALTPIFARTVCGDGAVVNPETGISRFKNGVLPDSLFTFAKPSKTEITFVDSVGDS